MKRGGIRGGEGHEEGRNKGRGGEGRGEERNKG